MAEMGFKLRESAPSKVGRTRTKKRVKVDPSSQIGHDFDILPGEMSVAFFAAARDMGLDVREVPTIIDTGFSTFAKPFSRKVVRVPGSTEDVSIGWGTVEIEGLGKIMMGTWDNDTRGNLTLTPADGEWNEDQWTALLTRTKELAPRIQMYKGRAFKVEHPSDLVFPKYLDLSATVEMILNEPVVRKLETSLFKVIRNHATLKGQVRTKRGIIMEGHYGTGKTSVAFNTAKECVKHGYGYMAISGRLAPLGLTIAKIIQPAVMFVEDMDEVTSGHRDSLNRLINTMSGIESKETDVIVVTSTNFIERIDKAFLRPERFDTIVKMELPTLETIERVIRKAAGDHLDVSEDIGPAVRHLLGATPAIIVEAVNLSKIDAICAGRKITADELLFHAKGLDVQKNLSNPEYKEESVGHKLVQSLYHATQYGAR